MSTSVSNNADLGRYELRLDGRLVGVADYVMTGERWVFPHTEIDASLRGHGLGAELVRGALDDVRRAGGVVVPHCWYVAQFIRDNPEYGDLLAP
jgi:predicted GNAT family acetyltransferase